MAGLTGARHDGDDTAMAHCRTCRCRGRECGGVLGAACCECRAQREGLGHRLPSLLPARIVTGQFAVCACRTPLVGTSPIGPQYITWLRVCLQTRAVLQHCDVDAEAPGSGGHDRGADHLGSAQPIDAVPICAGRGAPRAGARVVAGLLRPHGPRTLRHYKQRSLPTRVAPQGMPADPTHFKPSYLMLTSMHLTRPGYSTKRPRDTTTGKRLPAHHHGGIFGSGCGMHSFF